MIKKWNAQLILTGLMVVTTLAVWTILFFQIPFFTELPSWFWYFNTQPLNAPIFLLPIIILPFASYILLKRTSKKPLYLLILLIILGASYQFSFNFLEGDALNGLRSKKRSSGHSEFVTLASYQGNPLTLMKNYEELVRPYNERKKEKKDSVDTLKNTDSFANFDFFKIIFLGKFARSKPPGLSLIYIASDRISQAINQGKTYYERGARLLTFISVTWPFIAYLVLIPLFYFTKRIIDAETAKIACLFYSIVPSVNLIILHTDQAFFPLFFMTLLAASAVAFSKKKPLLAAPIGVLTYLIIFCSFGLVFTAPFVMALLYALSLDKQTGKPDIPYLTKSLLYYALGFLAADIFFRLTLNYDILVRYTTAVHHHREWKYWSWAPKEMLGAGLTNITEYILLVGIPMIGLAVMNSLRHTKTTLKNCLTFKWFAYKDILSLLTILIILFLCFFGQTRGESSRLFLFLVPLVCILAANETKQRFNTKNWFIPLCITLQVGTAILIKLYQDFY